jgi:hypothetical protein
MTQRSMDRYLGIAIDHGSSFDQWLRRWGADPSSRVVTKRAIISVCLKAGISGIVIGTDFNSGLEPAVSAAKAAGTETWLGLPDQEIRGEYDAARSIDITFPPGPALYMAKDAGAAGVKFSLSLARHARWSDVVNWLVPWNSVARELDLFIVVEPYFRVDDSANDRVRFLKAVRQLDRVRFVKLDVHRPEIWAGQYGQGFSPWLARSEGLDFSAFCNGLEQSLTAGCVGTMVGAAVWGIEQPLLSGRYTNELSRRLALLKNLVKPTNTPSSAGKAAKPQEADPEGL